MSKPMTPYSYINGKKWKNEKSRIDQDDENHKKLKNDKLLLKMVSKPMTPYSYIRFLLKNVNNKN